MNKKIIIIVLIAVISISGVVYYIFAGRQSLGQSFVERKTPEEFTTHPSDIELRIDLNGTIE